MLDKVFSPHSLEEKHYHNAQAKNAFAPQENAKQPYCIMMPPPNVTGSLHIGHALTFTLQDILIRFHRMKGYKTLWQAGMDHAGIATQMVVERELAKQNISRKELGREKFLEKVWEWKAHSGGTILTQLKKLGASADWSRERFTMDEGLSAAVRKVFVQLYQDGLIYKDKRLVNWDCQLQTAVSDLEVISKETNGAYYYIQYKATDGSSGIVVATTRPETLLGDTAVAVHPDDPRYQHLIGKTVLVPLVNREIPVVADTYSDPEKGTGAVKITPAHDFNDFQVGKRHHLPMINILEKDGTLNAVVPPEYQGLDRIAARKKIIADLQNVGVLEKIEETVHAVPYGDRSNTQIEPFLTDQWYVDAATLAKPALEAVENGTTRFIPEQWQNTYYHWMRTIEPWCISRQLWWGHQIPAWYDEAGNFYVAETLEEAQQQAGENVVLQQDADVLDTWFSSALWPFSTLGWPEETTELATYYPTSVLVTGFDIIFFWVARMMMLGLYFKKQVPFKDVYIHALVRDEHGQKMSKSKGNVIDPLELIEQYGTDALRFTLAIMAAQGRDVKLAPARVEGYRNFATKLWNASRFAEMNQAVYNADFQPEKSQHPINIWILQQLAQTIKTVETAIQDYKFNEAGEALYHFVWNSFCDWYVEFAKILLQQENTAVVTETQETLGYVLRQTVLILHPIMPFITEELAEKLKLAEAPLTLQSWPTLVMPEAEQGITWLLEAITAIRAAKAEMNIPPAAKFNALIECHSPQIEKYLEIFTPFLKRLARLENITLTTHKQEKALYVPVKEAIFILPLEGVIDIEAEKARLQKELEKIKKEQEAITARLQNPEFRAKAPATIISANEQKITDATQRIAAIHKILQLL